MCMCVLGFSREKEPIGHTHTHTYMRERESESERERDFKELVYVIAVGPGKFEFCRVLQQPGDPGTS